MALITTGSEKDVVWNRTALEAARAIQDTGTWILNSRAVDDAAACKAALRDYGKQGHDLIICHDAAYLKIVREIAPDFPASKFVVSGSADGGRGVATLDIRVWEASYLCGILAAKLVPDGPAGIVGPRRPKTVKQTLDAFVSGLRSVKADYAAHYKFVARPNDPKQTSRAARTLIDKHDVKAIFHVAGVPDSIFEAAKGTYVFGAKGGPPETAPAYIAIDMNLILRTLVKTIEDEAFEAQAYAHGLGNGGVSVVANPAFADKWPAGTLELIEKTKRDIIDGRIEVLKPR